MKKKSSPSVTIIILNYNGLEDTRNCLQSVQKTKYANFKVVVVDNGSKLPEAKILAKEFKDKRITYMPLKRNHGFSGGNNIATKGLTTKYIVLLNNDTKVEQNWLTELIKIAESDPSIAVCQAKLKSMSNPSYFDYAGAAGGFIDVNGYPFTRGRIFETIEMDYGQYDQLREIFWACGAAMLIRRSAIEKVGFLFDESFFNYMEEIDFCWRIWNAGYKVQIAPKAVVYHKVGATAERNLFKKRYWEHKNNLLLLSKHLTSWSLISVLARRSLLEMATYFYYLFRGKYKFFAALLWAHINFVSSLVNREINSQSNLASFVDRRIVYDGSVVVDHFLKQKKFFSQLKFGNRTSGQGSKLHKLVLILIATSLITVWFRDGKPIAVGEESFTIFNNISVLEQVSHWQNIGTGFLAPQFSIRLVPVLFASVSRHAGLSHVASQGLLMWSILILGMLATYHLADHFFQDKRSAFFAAVFYLLNLFSMSQVWSRFLYSGMFLWAGVPILLFYWLKWLEGGNKIYLALFGLASFALSNLAMQPAHILTIMFPLGLFCLVQVRGIKISRVAIGAIFWLVMNAWWIYPYMRLSGEAFAEIAGFKSNFDSLVSVSQYFPVSQIVLLRQKFLLSANSNWAGFYSQTKVIGLSVLVFLTALLGWLSFRKKKYWLFLTAYAILALVVVKGANPPLGHLFYEQLFSKLSFSMTLRNPYEKFGLNWLLPYSLFFGLGFSKIIDVNKRCEKILAGLGLLLACGVLVWPMWKGTIYSKKKAVFPEYYSQANTWLKKQPGDGRIFQVPATSGDSIVYDWGYGGVEPSEYIFERSSLAKINRSQYYDPKYKQLVVDFNSNTNIAKDFDELNIGYVVVHHDIAKSISWAIPQLAEAVISKNPQIQLATTFGDLDIYQVMNRPDFDLFEVSSPSASISYQRKGTRRYLVHVENASAGSSLFLKTTYSKFWQATVAGRQITDHVIEADYGNAWTLPTGGDYDIDIIFKVWPWE